MSFTLRIADPGDSKLLVELGAVCFSEAFAQHNSEEDLKNYLAEAFNEEKTKAELQDQKLCSCNAFMSDKK